MTHVDQHGRPEPPLMAGEVPTLLGFLDYQRATLAWKCGELDAAELRTTIAASSLTLGGILKHMAWVEDYWCSHRLRGHAPRPPWDTADWKSDPDWEFTSAADETPAQLVSLWHDAVAHSRTEIANVLADGGLDRPIKPSPGDDRTPTLRWILVHMIEEYARHNGHADLLREAVDGSVGE